MRKLKVQGKNHLQTHMTSARKISLPPEAPTFSDDGLLNLPGSSLSSSDTVTCVRGVALGDTSTQAVH